MTTVIPKKHTIRLYAYLYQLELSLWVNLYLLIPNISTKAALLIQYY